MPDSDEDPLSSDDEDLPNPLKTFTPEGLGSHQVPYLKPYVLDEDSGKEE